MIEVENLVYLGPVDTEMNRLITILQSKTNVSIYIVPSNYIDKQDEIKSYRKIDMCDVVIVNNTNYAELVASSLEESKWDELEYAKKLNKTICYLEKPISIENPIDPYIEVIIKSEFGIDISLWIRH